ncbi:MAG: sulfatase-like hydrolase/transferase [Myxococcales bacterium]|nr:sulfatase-like hydrolase/transferase [Myxococcales bacterium]
MFDRIKRALADRLPLFLFVFVNAILQTLFYWVQAGELIRVVKPLPNSRDELLFYSYTCTLFMGFALLLYLLYLASVSLVRRRGFDRVAHAAVIGIEALLALLIVVDYKVYLTLGMHLDADFIVRSMRSPGFLDNVRLGWTTWLSIGGALVAAIGLQLGVWRLLGEVERATGAGRWRATWIGAAIACCVIVPAGWSSADYGQRVTDEGSLVTDALPLFGRFVNPERLQNVLRPLYPAPNTPLPTIRRPKQVIFVLLETFRADNITPSRAPNLYRFAQRPDVLTSAHHFSGGHTTEYGMFASLYGVHSYHYYPFLQEQLSPFPLRVLKANGYRLGQSSSSSVRSWFMGRFMFTLFDEWREFTEGRTDENDERQLAFARRFRDARRADKKPGFLHIFFTATHHNYIYPKAFERHRPVLPEDYNHLMGDSKLLEHKEKIVNRYRNSVLYVDSLLGRLFALYHDEIERGEVLIVVTGDHGEEFWEHGLMGHGSTRFVNQRIQVPLLMLLPGQARRRVFLSGHPDIWPTLFDALGLADRLPPSRYSNGRSLLRPLPADRYVVVSGTGFPYSNRRVCLITPRHKLWLVKSSLKLDRFSIMRQSDLDDRPLEWPRSEIDALLGRFVSDLQRFLREGER